MDSRITNLIKDEEANLKLILLMAERRISNTELAKQARVSRSTIQRLRNGNAAHYDNMVRIAEVLGVEVKELL